MIFSQNKWILIMEKLNIKISEMIPEDCWECFNPLHSTRNLLILRLTMMASDFYRMLTKIKSLKLILHQAIMFKHYIIVHVINNSYQKVDFGYHKKFMNLENNLLNQERENWQNLNLSFYCMTWTESGEKEKRESSTCMKVWKHIKLENSRER